MAERHWHTTGKVLAVVFVLLASAAAIAIGVVIRTGVSARTAPTTVEAVIARAVRHFATPAAMRAARNPLPLTSTAIADGRAHWADHCASCHANDGSGDTEIGRGLYPRPPDMRKRATQELSDGELFSIIRNGVRLTGMPAWGSAAGGDDADNWKLVHFIRHLPKMTPDEVSAMEALNPKTPQEWQQMQEEAAFLAGGEPQPPAQQHHH